MTKTYIKKTLLHYYEDIVFQCDFGTDDSINLALSNMRDHIRSIETSDPEVALSVILDDVDNVSKLFIEGYYLCIASALADMKEHINSLFMTDKKSCSDKDVLIFDPVSDPIPVEWIRMQIADHPGKESDMWSRLLHMWDEERKDCRSVR